MTRSFLRTLLGLLLISQLGACSFLGDRNPFRDRTGDYLNAETVPPMQVPESLDSEVIGELYPIPEVGRVPEYQLGTAFEVPRIEPQMGESRANEVRIQTLGESTWILVSVPPSETWPRLRNFLSVNGIPTEQANASSGTIVTGWVSRTNTPDRLEQFRFRLEQGVQLNTTEILVDQRQYAADALPPVLPEWPAASDDAESASWMRTNLAQSLADISDIGTASLLGQEIGAARKVELVSPEDSAPYLKFYLARERAWASIGYALDTISFDSVERDVSAGVAVFDFYQEPPRDISTVAWIFGARNQKPTRWRLQLREVADGYLVELSKPDGTAADPRQIFSVLTRLRNNLT